jgi:hypothetical protein
MVSILEKLHREWEMIKAAPYSFSVVCLIAIGGVWTVFHYAYKEKFSDANTSTQHWKSESEYWKEQANRKSPAEQSKPAQSPERVPEPIKTKKSSSGPSQNTPDGTAIGRDNNAPIAIAPSGIANAAPNLGTQTVNNAPPARHLSDEQKAAITSFLQGKVCKITIISYAVNVDDAENYALELRDAFKSGGCSVPDQVIAGLSNDAILYGLRVDYHDDAWHVTGDTIAVPVGSPQEVIVKTLMSARVGRMAVGARPDVPDHSVQLIVGARPK